MRLVTWVNEVILRHVQLRINEHHLLHEMLNRNDLWLSFFYFISLNGAFWSHESFPFRKIFQELKESLKDLEKRSINWQKASFITRNDNEECCQNSKPHTRLLTKLWSESVEMDQEIWFWRRKKVHLPRALNVRGEINERLRWADRKVHSDPISAFAFLETFRHSQFIDS